MTMRIGLISDTHLSSPADDLWPQVYEAFAGVGLIMHAGDLYIPEVLDRLERVAPVVAVHGNGDYTGYGPLRGRLHPPTDPRLKEARVVAVHGCRIGLVHDFPLPEWPPVRTMEGLMAHFFGGRVDVVVRGNTHREEITTLKGVLVVNPGSPTYPRHQSLRLGTVGFLEVTDGQARASILRLR